MKKFLAILCGLLCLSAVAAEVIPPAPEKYFNDYAGVVSGTTAAQLNQRLDQFERDSSCQIVVAVYPKMQTDSSIEDYTVRVAQSWKVGQKDKNNGAVLLVFIQDRKMFIAIGYGLEGAMPDAICKRIIEDEIKPHFKAGDYDAGLTAGVNAMLAAAKGEYKGTGHTVADHSWNGNNSLALDVVLIFVFVFAVVIVSIIASAIRRSSYSGYYHSGGYYSRRGWGSGWPGGGWSSGSWGGGGGWSSGGSSSGGSFGGFSGGGGSFGGGGAGGSW